MKGLAVIQQENIEEARRAKAQSKTPYTIDTPDEIQYFPPFPFPSIGNHRPNGWKLEDNFLVDHSGFGSPREQAYTVDQFKRKLHKLLDQYDNTLGFAIIEQGEFQVVVGLFIRS